MLSSSSSSSVSWRITVAEIERQQRIMMNHQLEEVPLEEDNDACATASTSSMVDAAVAEGQDEKDHHSDDCPWPSWPFELMAVLGVLILGAVAITLIVLNSHHHHSTNQHSKLQPPAANDSSNNGTGQPYHTPVTSTPPDFTRTKYRDQIQTILHISNEQLANTGSATYKAFEWIVYQDSVPYNYTDFQLIQRFALIALHYSTGYWDPYQGGWGRISGTRTPECDWVGVECDEQYHVRGLQLQEGIAPTKLIGRIPSEIHWLQSLKSMVLSNNSLTGQLPSGLYSLRNLQNLDLSANDLNTTISPLIGNLTLLEGLDLRDNSMVGTLPSELGLLTELRQLFLSGNENVTGTIPTEMGALTILHYLEMENTGLEGSMPRQVCSLVALGQLVELRVTCNSTTLNCTCCNICQ